MKPRLIAIAAAVALAGASAASLAAERTVTLAVENMTCAACPYIVREAMQAVPGVSGVEVSYEARTATVTYDDARTTPEAIARASAGVGYPAKPAGSE